MRSSSKFLRDSRGVVLILVAVFLPVLFLGVKYLIDKGKVSFAEANRAGIARTIARTVQEKYKPEYSWDSQKDQIWQACVDVVKERYKKNIADNGLTLTLETESEDESRKGQLYVVCDCNFINKIAKAYIEELDADIIMSIPTTNTTETNTTNHIVNLASACGKFLADLDFYRVACSVIPYSGKITMFDEGATLWCTAFDKLTRPTYDDIKLPNSDYEVKYPTLKLFDLYSVPGDTEFYDTGHLSEGQSQSFLIMYRKKDFLLSTDDPAESDAKKFLLANIQPCSVRYYSMLAERSVPESHKFVAPYSMSPLTAGVTTTKQVFLNMQEIEDPYNTSNFLFLPVLWTNLLLNQSWTPHPTCHNKNGGKKRFAVLIANSENKFTTRELTYLGFSNDAATIPVPETTRLEIKDSSKDAHADAYKIEYKWNNGSSYICVKYPGLVTVKVEKIGGTTNNHTVRFPNIIKDNNLALNPDIKYTLHRDETEFFIHPKQLAKDVNSRYYRIDLELGNTKVKSIELTNRKFKLVEDSYNLTQEGNKYKVTWDHQPQPIYVTVVSTKEPPSVTFTEKNGTTKTQELKWAETKEFAFSYSSKYKLNETDKTYSFSYISKCPKEKFKYKLYNCSIKSIILTDRTVASQDEDDGDDGVSIKWHWGNLVARNISELRLHMYGGKGYITYSWTEQLPKGTLRIFYQDQGSCAQEGSIDAHYCHVKAYTGACGSSEATKEIYSHKCKHFNTQTHKRTLTNISPHGKLTIKEAHDKTYVGLIKFYLVFYEADKDVQQTLPPLGEDKWVSFVGGGKVKVTVVASECDSYFTVPKNKSDKKTELKKGRISKVFAPSQYDFNGNSITITTKDAAVESLSKVDGAYYTYAEFAPDAENDTVCGNCSNYKLDDDVEVVGIEEGKQFKILTANDKSQYSSCKWIANCNRALIRDCYQSNFSDTGQTESLPGVLDSLTQKACEQLKTAGIEKIYLIKYGINATVLDPYADVIYSIELDDKDTLKQTFDEIAADIKQTTLKTGKIVIREKDQE